MFKVTDSRNKRRKAVIGHAEMDVALGVLLAAVDFEWTCRRVILKFSKHDAGFLKEKFTKDYAAFGGLTKGWANEVQPYIRGKEKLSEVFDRWAVSCGKFKRPVAWSLVGDAMAYRNLIVHGSECNINRHEGRCAVFVLESACDILARFALENGKNLFSRIRRNGARTEQNHQVQIKKLVTTLGKNHWVQNAPSWQVLKPQ